MRRIATHPLALVLAASAALRGAWLLYARPVPYSDFGDYFELAQGLLRHGQFGFPMPTAFRLPLYPCFLALLMTVSDSIFWLSLSSVLLSIGLVAVVYRLALPLTGGNSTAAAWAALVCGINPTFVLFSPVLASEHLFALLLFGGLLCLMDMQRKQFIKAAAAGLLLGLSILTRGEGVFYAPAYLLLCAITPKTPREKVLGASIVLLACALVVAPWIVRNEAVVGPGAGLSTTGGVNFYFAHNADAYGWRPLTGTELEGLGEVEASRKGYEAGLNHIRQRGIDALFFDALHATIQHLYKFSNYALTWSTSIPDPLPGDPYHSTPKEPGLRGVWTLTLLSRLFLPMVMVLFALSVFSWRAAPRPAFWAPFLSIVALNWLCYAVVFYATDRYRFVAEVVLCLFAGLVLHGIISSTRKTVQRRSS